MGDFGLSRELRVRKNIALPRSVTNPVAEANEKNGDSVSLRRCFVAVVMRDAIGARRYVYCQYEFGIGSEGTGRLGNNRNQK